jgi:hypothetical protein
MSEIENHIIYDMVVTFGFSISEHKKIFLKRFSVPENSSKRIFQHPKNPQQTTPFKVLKKLSEVFWCVQKFSKKISDMW